MKISNKLIDATIDTEESVWISSCEVYNCVIRTKGDLTIDGECTFTQSPIYVDGTLVIKSNVTLNDPVSVKFLAAQSPFEIQSTLNAGAIFTCGESHFGKIICNDINFNGTVFAATILSEKIEADGDLIADMISSFSIDVRRGSLLCPHLDAVTASAPIIGNYTESRLDTMRYHFQWARPMILAGVLEPEIRQTVNNGLATLYHYGKDIPEIVAFDERIRAIGQCGDFKPIFTDLLVVLKKHYQELKPSVQQFIDCVDQHGFPDLLWRF